MYKLEELKLESLTSTPHPLEFMALCPFHEDNHVGTFFINAKTGWYHCFSCNAAGNIQTLIQKTNGKIEYAKDNEVRHIKKLLDLKWSALLSAPLAINNSYLNSRKVNEEIVRKFDIRETDHSIVFPLRNFTNTIIGFQERTYSGIPSRYRIWGVRPPFYIYKPIEEYWDVKRLFIVEGIFGVINAYRAGYTAVSFLGASTHEITSLRLLQNDEVVVLYDDDESGIRGANWISKKTRGRIKVLPGCEADEITKNRWDNLNVYSFDNNEKI